ncbi:MAG: hypothetical protein JWN99_1024 [Ilumatobacteraceae bacterium]|nr:hypothetical protein [Ilumatobacteraceae bacterium]
MDEATQLLASGLGDLMGLTDQRAGLLRQAFDGRLDGCVDAALDGFEALVQLGQAVLETGNDLLDLGPADAELLNGGVVAERVDQFAATHLRLLHGQDAEADDDVGSIAGDAGELGGQLVGLGVGEGVSVGHRDTIPHTANYCKHFREQPDPP